MKEKGQDKINKICDLLRRESIEPAKHEADEILKQGKERAEQIILQAEAQAAKIVQDAKEAMKQEYNIFHSSLTQGLKQTLESLRQSIEKKLFNDSLEQILAKESSDPKIIANLINAVVDAIQSGGLSKEFSAIIPQAASSAEISRYLAEGVLDRLKDQCLELGNFAGGARIKLVDKKLTLDISDKALYDFMKGYVRKDFRKLIFIEPSS